MMRKTRTYFFTTALKQRLLSILNLATAESYMLDGKWNIFKYFYYFHYSNPSTEILAEIIQDFSWSPGRRGNHGRPSRRVQTMACGIGGSAALAAPPFCVSISLVFMPHIHNFVFEVHVQLQHRSNYTTLWSIFHRGWPGPVHGFTKSSTVPVSNLSLMFKGSPSKGMVIFKASWDRQSDVRWLLRTRIGRFTIGVGPAKDMWETCHVSLESSWD